MQQNFCLVMTERVDVMPRLNGNIFLDLECGIAPQSKSGVPLQSGQIASRLLK